MAADGKQQRGRDADEGDMAGLHSDVEERERRRERPGDSEGRDRLDRQRRAPRPRRGRTVSTGDAFAARGRLDTAARR